MTFTTKMHGLQISITTKARDTLDRQARERGLSTSQWAGQVFDIGFAAACGREKGMPVSDGDLDAICGATLLLKFGKSWKPDEIARGLGVSVAVVKRILDGWKDYRRGCEATAKGRRKDEVLSSQAGLSATPREGGTEAKGKRG